MPKRAVFERSRQELSLDVSVGVHILLVTEQSSLESQSINSINRGWAKTVNTDTYGTLPRLCTQRHNNINNNIYSIVLSGF